MNHSALEFTQVACNPHHSVVVEACAGSGKTWLLTARLFRLLLDGARPEQILAITFTRKAAREMQERLFGLLRECALQPDAQLSVLLEERGAPATAANLQKARALAGDVLTNSRGLTIDTFHGWFASLCQMAPMASGFSRQSEPTDQTAYWMDVAIDEFIRQLLDGPPDSPLLAAFDRLATQFDRSAIRQVLHMALTNRVACSLWLDNPDAPALAALFDMEPGQQWPEEVLKSGEFLSQWQTAASWLGTGTPRQRENAVAIEKALSSLNGLDGTAPASLAEVFNQLKLLCLTSGNEPAKSFSKLTKPQTQAGLDATVYVQLFESLANHMAWAIKRQRDQLDLQATEDMQCLIQPLFDTYRAVKAEAGLCDFDDLEATALRMLMDENQRAYMQQKLDTRVQHLLVDEFQDTNPVQWNILKLWLQEYSGPERPSVFLVGDPKQSIYRFRRAEARLFRHAREWLVEHFNACTLESDSTRRCAPGVIEVVNRVFGPGELKGQTPFRAHTSLANPAQASQRASLSGLHVYPILEPDTAGPDEARQVVQTIQLLMKRGDIANLGQVMVLVRAHKSGLPLMAALREAGLAYTIKDKGERYTSPVWSDTIALLGFLNNPHGNLHLLQLLRCPLIGLASTGFQELMEAAPASLTTTVWATLQGLAVEGRQPWVRLHAQLAGWLEMARALPLFETLSRVIDDTGAPRNYLNATSPRQRVMMAEHWDWLKAWALNLNKGRFPDLQQAYDEAVKLQTHASSDSEGAIVDPHVLRIMTVHSAKGLEADHVWLFDGASVPRPGGSNAGLLIDWALGESHPVSVTVMSNLKRESAARQAAQAIENQAHLDEEDHLLYVALTRARHSIHLSGTVKRNSAACWYERLKQFATHLHENWPQHAAEPDGSAAQHVGQIELPGLFDPPAFWKRAQFPALTPLAQGVGRVVPRLDSSELRKGTAWHAAMEWVDQLAASSFDDWWIHVRQRCESVFRVLRDDEAGQVEQACRLLAGKADLQPWLHLAQASQFTVFNELEWVLGDGRSLRADRVLGLQDRFLVLDYKWTVNEINLPDYTRQVLEYVNLVDQTLNRERKPAPTQAALIDRHGQVHWLTSV